MITISHAIGASGAAKYYKNDAENEGDSPHKQTAEQNQTIGKWHGALREKFGLGENATFEQFERLCDGQHPVTGEQLIRHVKSREFINKKGKPAKTMTHRACWDVTFSAPKSVSLAALVGGDERIIEINNQAALVALGELHKLAHARMGNVKPAEHTGELLTLVLTHKFARPDKRHGTAAPDLHNHGPSLNVIQCKNGKWRSVDPQQIFAGQAMAQAIYYSELAKGLIEIGYELRIDEKTNAPEIVGITREYINASSPRQNEIKETAEKLNVKSTRGVAGKNRRSKNFNHARMRERHQWLDREFGDQAKLAVEQARSNSAPKNSETEKTVAAENAATFCRNAPNAAREQVADAIGRARAGEIELSRRGIVAAALENAIGRATLADVAAEIAIREQRGEIERLPLFEKKRGQRERRQKFLAEAKPNLQIEGYKDDYEQRNSGAVSAARSGEEQSGNSHVHTGNRVRVITAVANQRGNRADYSADAGITALDEIRSGKFNGCHVVARQNDIINDTRGNSGEFAQNRKQIVEHGAIKTSENKPQPAPAELVTPNAVADLGRQFGTPVVASFGVNETMGVNGTGGQSTGIDHQGNIIERRIRVTISAFAGDGERGSSEHRDFNQQPRARKTTAGGGSELHAKPFKPISVAASEVTTNRGFIPEQLEFAEFATEFAIINAKSTTTKRNDSKQLFSPDNNSDGPGGAAASVSENGGHSDTNLFVVGAELDNESRRGAFDRKHQSGSVVTNETSSGDSSTVGGKIRTAAGDKARDIEPFRDSGEFANFDSDDKRANVGESNFAQPNKSKSSFDNPAGIAAGIADGGDDFQRNVAIAAESANLRGQNRPTGSDARRSDEESGENVGNHPQLGETPRAADRIRETSDGTRVGKTKQRIENNLEESTETIPSTGKIERVESEVSSAIAESRYSREATNQRGREFAGAKLSLENTEPFSQVPDNQGNQFGDEGAGRGAV